MNSSSFDLILRRVLLVPILAVLLGAGALVWQMHSAAATVKDIELDDDRIAATLVIEKLVVDQENSLRGYQATHNEQFLSTMYSAELKLPEAFARRREMMISASRRQEIVDIENARQLWEDGFADPLIAAIKAGADTTDPDLNLTIKRRMDEIRQRLFDLDTVTQAKRTAAIQLWRRQVREMTIALIGLAMLIGVSIGVYVRRLLRQVSEAYRESHQVLHLRAEQAFASEQKLLTTLASIGEGVITCTAEGKIASINPAACELTGRAESEAVGMPLMAVLNALKETTREPIENPMTRASSSDRAVSSDGGTSILIRPDGSELFVNGTAAAIRDKQHSLLGVVIVFRDVTMERKSQRALVANEKLAVAGRLASTIAHEIHNPLDSVANLLFLMDGNSSAEESSQFLHMAKSELARVTQISRAMLSLHRESRAPVPLDLREMLTSILLLLDRRFRDLNVSVQQVLPTGMVVQGFPAELRQVFTNLLTNAAEASSEVGTIYLRAERMTRVIDGTGWPRDGVCVSIEDHGAGVSEEVRAQLFKPFFTTKGEKGTGLGLWVSQGIVHKHGGIIEFASSIDEEEHGTTVSVFLPATRESQSVPEVLQ